MTYAALLEELSNIHDLSGARAILSWDQETMMPAKGAPARARQMSALAGIIHERVADPKLGALIAAAEGEELDEVGRANVREARRDHEAATKIPVALVKELSEACSAAHQAWLTAKKADDFAAFAPHLEKLIALKRREAEHRDPSKPIYDVLLDQYEPGLTAAQCSELFDALKARLIPLVADIAAAADQPELSPLQRPYAIDRQEAFGRETVELMGFDMAAGRVDVSAHPFCGGVGPGDVRLTTRYDENEVLSSYFSFVHEAGHGLYEQGLDPELFGSPAGQAASMAIHESQSRLWENFIARSAPYWDYMFPRFLAAFGEQAAGLDRDGFFRALNAVTPSLRRVEADEVTYNLHIILRFELEAELMSGRLAVAELEAAWNAKMKEYLGIEPAASGEGVLQDIHWAFAAFGYFPTYSLGNVYAAQIAACLRRSIDGFDDKLRAGELGPIRDWLRAKIHRRGKVSDPRRLIEEVTGEAPDPRYLLDYLDAKFRPLYGIG